MSYGEVSDVYMISLNITVLVATILLLFLFIFMYFRPQLFKKRNNKVAVISDYVQFISVMVAVITLGITCLINILSHREGKLSISIVNGYGKEMNAEKVELGIDSNEHLTFVGAYENQWQITLYNDGDAICENVVVRISISDVMFLGIIDDYHVSTHLHGLGGYKYLVREYDNIKPDEKITLPYIPLENTKIVDDSSGNNGDGFVLTIEIYSKQSIVKSKNIKIVKKNTDKVSFACESRIDEDNIKWNDHAFSIYMNNSLFSDSDFIMYDIDFKNIGYKDYYDCVNIVKKELFSSADYQRLYKYYLTKLNVYNDEARLFYTKFATIYGRLYYLSVSDDDIERKVQNDIQANTVR